jgi:acetyl-CoA carboxylase alpha subunit
MKKALLSNLERYKGFDREHVLRERREKYRNYGVIIGE